MVSSESDFSRSSGLARREFLALPAGALVAAGAANRAAGADDRVIRLGVVGCGGRGTGAALQAAAADAGVRIVGLADAFADQVAAAAHILSRDAAYQFDCPVTRRFSGPDAHRRVLDLGVDAVVIAAPPHLRPTHVEAAVTAGCHVFCETPAAIDLAAAARVAAALARAGVAGRVVASGLHSRRDAALAAVVDEVRAGAWGPPRSVDVHAAFDRPWQVPALAGRSPAEERLRNWISCAALSGGAFVERHVHAIDRGLWVLGDRPPAVVEPLSATVPGAVAVRFRFEDGTEIRASAMRAHGPARIRETVTTSRGARDLQLSADGSRYRATMQAFVQAIRTGRPLDEGGILLRGTIAALLGRMVAETGRPIAWEDAVASETPAFLVRQICQGVNPAEV